MNKTTNVWKMWNIIKVGGHDLYLETQRQTSPWTGAQEMNVIKSIWKSMTEYNLKQFYWWQQMSENEL